MSNYYAGLSMRELQEQYASDELTMTRGELAVRYGTDKPRFMGLGGRTGRPSSTHLRSPQWVDAQGREYTPEEPGSTDHWWVRIPLSVTLRTRRAIDAADMAPSDAVGFPSPGETLQLQRAYSGVDGRQVTVRVASVIAPKKASAELYFEQEVDATWSEREKEFMRRKTENHQRKRTQESVY